MIKFIAMLLLTLPILVFAEGYSCIGMDETGQTIKVIFDVSTGGSAPIRVKKGQISKPPTFKF